MKDDGLYIIHMQECISRIQAYTAKGRRQFFSSRLIQDAVLRNLQTLGESSKRLSKTIKDSAPTLPWRQIADFRNVLVREYLGVDLEVVWKVIHNDLAPLDDFLKLTAARLGLPKPRLLRRHKSTRKKRTNKGK